MMAGGYVHANLMLLDLVNKTTEESLGVGRQIRRHARYDGRTPLVVMAQWYGKDVEGTNVNVEHNDWIFYLGEEPEQLNDLLRRLIKPGADGAAGRDG